MNQADNPASVPVKTVVTLVLGGLVALVLASGAGLAIACVTTLECKSPPSEHERLVASLRPSAPLTEEQRAEYRRLTEEHQRLIDPWHDSERYDTAVRDEVAQAYYCVVIHGTDVPDYFAMFTPEGNAEVKAEVEGNIEHILEQLDLSASTSAQERLDYLVANGWLPHAMPDEWCDPPPSQNLADL